MAQPEQHTSTPARPNLLLIVLDTVRADHLPPHPLGSRLAPRLSREAEAGEALERVHATAPWTLPSHASMLSGAYPTEHGIHGRTALRNDGRLSGLRSEVERQGSLWLPEALRRNGYRTWAVSANPWISQQLGFSFGFDEFVAVGPARLRPRVDSGGTRIRPQDRLPAIIRRPAGRVARHVQEWIGVGDSGGARAVEAVGRMIDPPHPFFGLVNLMEAHVPYAPPKRFNELRGMPALMAPAVSRKRRSYEHTLAYNLRQAELSDSELETIRALYRGEIRFLDHLVGEILNLVPRGRTVVVVTSDHGEALGEDHQLDHQLTVTEAVLRVPFIVLGPARLMAPFVSLRQVPEFLAQVAGIDASAWHERARVPEHVAVSEYESAWAHDRRSESIARRRGFPADAIDRLKAEMGAVVEGDRKLLTVGGHERLLAVRGLVEEDVDEPETMDRLRGYLRWARRVEAPASEGRGYTPEEEAEIERRLAQLGYM